MAATPIDFDLAQIMAMLPHRYPFLMIDRVMDVVADRSAVGLKNVTIDEPYFRGLPPARCVMPATMIIEAMAQTAAVAAIHTLGDEAADKFIYFMTLQRFRVRRAVRPGDRLMLHVYKERAFGPALKVRGEARVDGALAATAYLTAMMLDRSMLA
jgi:3-hydroxyacyl-[acyl-carrier-protein] dehydratase